MDTYQVAMRALTRNTRWVVLDIETTPSDDGQHVVSIGINQWRMDATSEQPTPHPIEWFVDPGVPIENTRIHHITTKTLTDNRAQEFAFYINRLNAALTARPGEHLVLVAHYANFDVGVLHMEYARAGQTFPDVALLDTSRLARWLDVPATSYKLPALLAWYGLAITNHHSAAADASDTAELLRLLLRDAIGQGVSDFGASHPTKKKDPVLGRTANIEPYLPARGRRAARRSGFTFIERPDAHRNTHKALPKNPSQGALHSWLADAQTCAELRCPALPAKVDRLRWAKDQMLTAFLTDWDAQLADGETAAANTSLGAVLNLLPKVTPRTNAHAWFLKWGPKLRSAKRCPTSPAGGAPVDACPDCRAYRACPADIWTHAVAAVYLGAGRNFNWLNSQTWITSTRRLKGLVRAGYSDIAAHAAWLLVEMLTPKKPAEADKVAKMASDLDLVSPLLTHRAARVAEAGAGRTAALALIDKASAHRDGSTDRAWADLLSYRDAIVARQVASGRAPTGPAPYRTGHTAPADRPDRRRFQLDTSAVKGPAAPGARKKRRTSLRGSPVR